ncbi:MAG: hydantoinase/oxoprolinase family protein [Chloroflexi bacterium]|nr:hydantoinase/oxoprolinase family protein [Chloroflexota bacterium]
MVGVDIGGTFTDFAFLRDGRLIVHKVPSTPRDQVQAVVEGLRDLKLPRDCTLVHGSTVATNALLERKGARTALITTRGFEDVIEIGRQNRPALYDLLYRRPPSLVPRDLRFGVPERVDHQGRVVVPLDPQEVQRVVEQLANAGVEAVAVSLLFSFLNSEHERALGEALGRLGSRPFVSLSSEVLPEFREYERTSTVAVNAYIGPVVSRYVRRLAEATGMPVRIMQSSGGSIPAELAASQPVRTILSGPAGGVVGATYVARIAGFDHVITFDMGGTSADVSLCPGRVQATTSSSVGGYPVSVPMIDIHTVGAGGGSIARVDVGGALVVGPESAGAEPGPACYGRGAEPTVTDANLVLGRMDPRHFLGGRMSLDTASARRALERLGRQMGADAIGAAQGVVRVVNSNMERALRAISLERGYDPREFTLVAFGGAGPMHACHLAQELGIPRVLVPPRPGILSALGVAIADVVKDYSQTLMLRGEAISRPLLEGAFRDLEARGRREMASEGLPPRSLRAQRALDVRYVGQSYELTVDWPARARDLYREVARRFHMAHMRRFGYRDEGEPIEVVNVRVRVVSPVELPPVFDEAAQGPTGDALLGHGTVIFNGEATSAALYLRERLHAGEVVPGPAVLFQMDATTVVPPGWVAAADTFRNLAIMKE